MKEILKEMPTEEEIDAILDGGYEIEIWTEGGAVFADVLKEQ